MGMDVYGRQPTAEAGKYFRASIWEWPPILELMVRLCPELLDVTVLSAMAYNVGKGPVDPHVCEVMADRFADRLKAHPDGHEVHLGFWLSAAGDLLTDADRADRRDESLMSAHRADGEQIREWIEFLRHCGGFEVW